MFCKESGCGEIHCVHLPEGGVNYRILGKTDMKIRFLYVMGVFYTR